MMTMEEIREEVMRNGDLLSLPMQVLRDAKGYRKLGVKVIEDLSRTLAGYGIGHFPKTLPSDQYAVVRLFRLGSPAAELIDAVLTPSTEKDEVIRAALDSDAEEIVRQIRVLVSN
jgi:hypothetical protein